MNIVAALEITLAVILSLGGGGSIVFALSNCLGKIWAQRLMIAETAKFQKEIEALKSDLNSKVLKEIEALKSDLNSKAVLNKQKIELYTKTSEPLINFILDCFIHKKIISEEAIIKFDKIRLETTAHLSMFAPAAVFDQYNTMIDYTYNCLEKVDEWSFKEFETLGLKYLNLIRKDINLHSDEVTYAGSR
jgi:hypothetical protein